MFRYVASLLLALGTLPLSASETGSSEEESSTEAVGTDVDPPSLPDESGFNGHQSEAVPEVSDPPDGTLYTATSSHEDHHCCCCRCPVPPPPPGTPQSAPEPSTLLLASFGVSLLAARAYRRRPANA